MNATSPPNVLNDLQLTSSTKDSLHIRWNVYDHATQNVESFKVRYQAEGSRVVQLSHTLRPSEHTFDITQLHENTYYNICVMVYTNLSSHSHPAESCIHAKTYTNSLSVALGSTFGAFLALGIIVLFVFVAKWQNTRKLHKQLKEMANMGDTYDSISHHEPDIEMSDISLQVHDDTQRLEFSSQSSQVSGSNSKDPKHQRQTVVSVDENEEFTDSENNTIKLLAQNGAISSEPVPSTSGLSPNDIRRTKVGLTQDVRPKPSNPAFLDPNSSFANQPVLPVLQAPGIQTGLRPNLSCNW